jgi:hypothetical protein
VLPDLLVLLLLCCCHLTAVVFLYAEHFVYATQLVFTIALWGGDCPLYR